MVDIDKTIDILEGNEEKRSKIKNKTIIIELSGLVFSSPLASNMNQTNGFESNLKVSRNGQKRQVNK